MDKYPITCTNHYNAIVQYNSDLKKCPLCEMADKLTSLQEDYDELKVVSDTQSEALKIATSGAAGSY